MIPMKTEGQDGVETREANADPNLLDAVMKQYFRVHRESLLRQRHGLLIQLGAIEMELELLDGKPVTKRRR